MRNMFRNNLTPCDVCRRPTPTSFLSGCKRCSDKESCLDSAIENMLRIYKSKNEQKLCSLVIYKEGIYINKILDSFQKESTNEVRALKLNTDQETNVQNITHLHDVQNIILCYSLKRTRAGFEIILYDWVFEFFIAAKNSGFPLKLFIILTDASELVKRSCLSIPHDKPLPEKTEEQWISLFDFDSQVKEVGNWFLCENTELSKDQEARIGTLLGAKKAITTDTQVQDSRKILEGEAQVRVQDSREVSKSDEWDTLITLITSEFGMVPNLTAQTIFDKLKNNQNSQNSTDQMAWSKIN